MRVLLDDVVSIFKGITIDNVVYLNVYNNPSFCSTLNVFKNGISAPWLNLKLSSIKSSSCLGVFLIQNFMVGEFVSAYGGGFPHPALPDDGGGSSPHPTLPDDGGGFPHSSR
jgi:hypothetical protein